VRWIVQHGCMLLPASKNPVNINENINISDFELTAEDVEMMDARARAGQRERVTFAMGLGFEDEFDFV